MPAMSTELVIAIVVAVIVLVAIIAYLVSQRRRSEGLRNRFGPEYGRTVHEYGDQSQAEAALGAREERVKQFETLPLTDQGRARFTEQWRALEVRFVDDPKGAIAEADQLISSVMQARGYPESDFQQRVADLSTTYPRLVDDYRTIHDLSLRTQRGEGSTEDLRKALVSCRRLFEELVGTQEPEKPESEKRDKEAV
jgi:hypothetical protein